MFNQLANRFDSIFRNLRGLGKITDSNIQQTSREIRRVLLEADVNLEVTKEFVDRVKDRAEGTKVLKSVKPGEQFIKIIHDELVTLLGKEVKPLELGSKKPAVILIAGLQGSGKTTTCGKLANLLKTQKKSDGRWPAVFRANLFWQAPWGRSLKHRSPSFPMMK